MAERIKRSLRRTFWRMCWLIAATAFLFFGVAEFARQHQAEKVAASNGIVSEESGILIGQDAAIGLVCIAMVCLLLALRKRHHKANA